MSVEFEPVRLGRRGRRLDPVIIGAVAVAVALGAAVLKPWNEVGPAAGGVVQAPPSSIASVDLSGPHNTAAVALPRVIRGSAASSLTWSQVAPFVHRHETWGVRAIVVQPSGGAAPGPARSLTERWLEVFPSDADDVPTAQLDPSDRSIVALGVTFPPAHTPLDVRIWRQTTAGLEWIDTQPVDVAPSAGAFLYIRPGLPGGPSGAWTSGTYRIDLLVDGSIRRVALTIPDRFSNVPEPVERRSLRDVGPLVGPTKAPLSDLPVGLFATVGGVAVPLSADEGGPLDETAAWLDIDPRTGRPPRSFVARTYLPRATGLGVALRTRAVVVSATLDRLAPEPLATEAERVDSGAQDGSPSSLVLFKAPDGAAWTPGAYRLSVVWADVEGLHRQRWHAELRPGPVREAPPMLAAARAWTRYAGSTGVILGTAEPLGTGSTDDAIRLVHLRPETASYPATTGVGCGGTVIDTSPGVLGFAYPANREASTVRARILRPFLRRDDQVMMTARFGVRGLVLAAPARIATLPGADYVFTVGEGDGAQTFALCLGMQNFDD